MTPGDPAADPDAARRRAFMRALLDDVRALERMLEEGRIESGVRRIGVEQEFFLVTPDGEPAPVATELLERLDDPRFTTELARFNLEANIAPLEFGGACLRKLEAELLGVVDAAREGARACGAEACLAGILPTLRISDASRANMTPVERYAALDAALRRLRGGRFRIGIQGIDELFLEHDNVMLEACNTSFQVHFQVGPAEFATLYNLAQAATAPVLAAAANSPLFLDRRLWHETRVALFRSAVDSRSDTAQSRGQRARVRFGDGWLQRSVLEVFREDIARFRVLLEGEPVESSLQALEGGRVPELDALRLFNGTVYRWNRPCYGVADGRAHLRIENRALPAGPTVLDEMANAAFFFGLMTALPHEYGDVTRAMPFEDARGNFLAAARHGLRAQFRWLGGAPKPAAALILDPLARLAREGLASRGISKADVDRFLGVIEERVHRDRTGAQWALDSLAGMETSGSMHQRCRALVASTMAQQQEERPVHEWRLAELADARDWRKSYRTVEQVMTDDLFTVQPDDLVDLAANLMDWRHIRHVPVEDGDGHLVGIVSHRALVRLLARGTGGPVPVRTIMKPNPITVTPETSTLEAIEAMRRHRVACLPVVSGGKLVGILTERDLLDVAARLFDEQMRGLGES